MSEEIVKLKSQATNQDHVAGVEKAAITRRPDSTPDRVGQIK